MAPYSIMITGANRGIGLGFVREFLKNKEIRHIIATARDPKNAQELNAIKDDRLSIVELDVRDDDSIRKAFKEVEQIVGDRGLTILINNAGIFLPYFFDKEPNRADLAKHIDTNAISVVILTQIFLPLLRKAAAHGKGDEFSPDRAAIINMSSDMGSIGANKDGSGGRNGLAYRASKSTQNSVSKTIAVDVEPEHILVVSIHPGWVRTRMGGDDGEFSVEESVSAMVTSIAKLNKMHHGGYFSKTLEAMTY